MERSIIIDGRDTESGNRQRKCDTSKVAAATIAAAQSRVIIEKRHLQH
jgi:hypothetical protein